MARGGARPGAGRPRKGAVTPVPVSSAVPAAEPAPRPVVAAALPADVTVPALDAGLTPLDYMLQVMRDPSQDSARRDRMAMAAAPFVHIRAADAKPGKKDLAADAAKTAAKGKFSAAPAPLKLASSR